MSDELADTNSSSSYIESMLRTGILALVTMTLPASSLQLDAQSACTAKVESFGGEKPIGTLPIKYRDGIIAAVLPDLKAQANGSGYDPEDLRPAKLAYSLHYSPVSTSSQGEQLWVVRFNTKQACDAHDGCASYVVSSNSKGIRNILRGREGSFGTSAGGAFGIAILQTEEPAYPELLFLSHLSAYETAVSCFAWSGSEYRSAPCTPECAHFMDTPRPN
jgi:hypothetical protein